jgi:hypothetical protein
LVHLPFCSGGLRLAQWLGLEQAPGVVYFGVATAIATIGATALAAMLYYAVERPVLASRPGVTNRPWARYLAATVQVSLVPAGIVYWLSIGGATKLAEWWRSLVWVWDV